MVSMCSVNRTVKKSKVNVDQPFFSCSGWGGILSADGAV